MKNLRTILYMITLILVIGVICVLAALCSRSDMSVGNVVREEISGTPALLDSIRSIHKWELVSIDAIVEVDTTRSRWMGMKEETIRRRYYGRLSIGIDLDNASTNWHQEHGDTINISLPDIILLDDKFIDESRTILVQTNSKDFEQDSKVRQQMYISASRLMIQRNLTTQTRQQARKRAEDELFRLFRNLGYNTINVSFK